MKIPLILKAFGIAIPVGATFVDFVGYIARVDGISMRPSLNPNPGQVDFVFLNKWAVRNYDISRGEIISLISPKNPDQRFIKRVVGLEGDVISTTRYKKSVVTVPAGHCWVEGDHVGSSLDSNSFGPVALGLITAKATHIVWPPSRYIILLNDEFFPRQLNKSLTETETHDKTVKKCPPVNCDIYSCQPRNKSH